MQSSFLLWLDRAPIARSLVVAVCALGLASFQAQAFQADPNTLAFEVLAPLEQSRFVTDAADLAADPGAQSFNGTLRSALGDGWQVTSWNQYSGAPRSIVGPGLTVAAGGLAGAQPHQVEALAREVIASYPQVFLTDGSDLVLDQVAHGAGRWGVIFHQEAGGVPVQDSQVVLALHDNGRLFAMGANVYRDIDVATASTLEPAVTRAVARASVPFDPSVELTPGPDAQVIVPVHVAPGQVDFKLAHITDVPTSAPYGMWRTWVDAHTGDILYRDNQVEQVYEGSVDGDVEIYSYCDGNTPDTPFHSMNIFVSGVGTGTTDANGDFSFGADAGTQTFNAQFNGPDFNVNCSGCVDAQMTGSIDPNVPESLVFDAGTYRADERDVFYFSNLTKTYVEGIDPGFTQSKYTCNVNVNGGGCNANWGGTVMNFFRADGACANTGEIGSVVAHEFGHGVQNWALGGGQGPEGLGEGNSDIMSTFITDDPLIGNGFTTCGFGIRNCDNELRYPDDLGGGIHSEGRIICGFNWDVRQNLEVKLGNAAGKAKTAELWHFARRLFMNSGNNQPDQVERYFWVDDDDGDLVNGTPNYYEIADAAIQHGFVPPLDPNRISIAHTPLGDTLGSGPFSVTADVQTFVDGVQQTADLHQVFYAVNGGAFLPLDMTNAGGDTWEASIPAQQPNSAIAYYLRVESLSSSVVQYEPLSAPTEFFVFGAGQFTDLIDNDMETDDGYTVGSPDDNATDGVWERGDPIALLGGAWMPEDDHTPSGTDCWVTGIPPDASNPFAEELDGRTSFVTPTIDLTSANMVQGTFWYWTRIGTEDPDNYVELQISGDGGASWTTAARVTTESSPDWQQAAFRLTPWETSFTGNTKFRFVAQDGTNTIMNVLVDDWFVERLAGATAAIEADDLQPAAPLSLRLGNARPNPFNPSTAISFTLPERADVSLDIYDVGGRLVRSLLSDSRAAGTHVASWDGRTESGSRASSGTYYYKLEVGSWSQTRSMVLLK